MTFDQLVDNSVDAAATVTAVVGDRVAAGNILAGQVWLADCMGGRPACSRSAGLVRVLCIRCSGITFQLSELWHKLGIDMAPRCIFFAADSVLMACTPSAVTV
jgi:hypothetical protein